MWPRSSQRKAIIRTHLLSETSSDYIGLVRLKGLEPTRIAAREPKGDVTSVANNDSINRHGSVSLQQWADVVPVGKGVR